MTNKRAPTGLCSTALSSRENHVLVQNMQWHGLEVDSCPGLPPVNKQRANLRLSSLLVPRRKAWEQG